MTKAKEDLKILIVDDDEKSLKLLEAILIELGYNDILKAVDGKMCLSLAQNGSPDLILLDIMMPEMAGGEVKEQLLDNPRTRDIPVIFITAIITDEEVKKMDGEIAGSLYLAKPYDKNKLSQAIDRAMGTMY